MTTVRGKHRHETRIHRIVLNVVCFLVSFGNHDGAGTATSFGASEFASSQEHDITKKRKERLIRSSLRDELIWNSLAIDKEDWIGAVSYK